MDFFNQNIGRPPPLRFGDPMFQPERTEPNGLRQNQDILAQLIGSHGQAGQAFLRAYGTRSGDLQEAFLSLSSVDQTGLTHALGNDSLREIFSLGEESDLRLFANDFLQLGRNLESREKFNSASLVYRLAATTPTLSDIRDRAQHRLEVLQGNGTLGEHLEFLSTQFAGQVTDPGLFLGMLAAGGAFRSVSGGLLRWLGPPSFASRALAWTAGFGAEVPAFTLTVRGIHELQGHHQDWSLQALRDDFYRTGLTLFFLKASAGLGQNLVGNLIRGNAPLTPWTRFSTLAIPQLTLYTGLLGSHAIEQYCGLRPEGAHPLLDSLVTLLHFNIAGKILSSFSPPTPADSTTPNPPFQNWLRQLSHGFRLGEDPNTLITPEGIRVDVSVLQMSGKPKEVPEGTPSTRGPEGQERQPSSSGVQDKQDYDPNLAPFQLHRDLFDEIRKQFWNAGAGFYDLLNIKTENPLWLHRSRTSALQIRSLVGLSRDSLSDHPYQMRWAELFDQIIEELDRVNGMLHSPPASIPSSRSNKLADVFFAEMWRNPNQMVDFIYTGEPRGLRGALRATTLARETLEKLLNQKSEPLSGPETAALLAPRNYFEADWGQFMRLLPEYEWLEGSRADLEDIPGTGHRVLVLGEVGLIRDSLAQRQILIPLPSDFFHHPNFSETLRLQQRLLGREDSPSKGKTPPQFDYLEFYNLPPAPRSQGEAIFGEILSALRPGGIGYLVQRNGVQFNHTLEILTQNQWVDIIGGSRNAPLPVKSYDLSQGHSNYLFFRKLPYR